MQSFRSTTRCHQCIKRVDIVDENIHFIEQKPLVTLENFFATVVALKAAEGTLAVGIQNIQKKQGDMVTLNLLRQVVKGKNLPKIRSNSCVMLWLEPWFCLPCSSPVWHRGLLQAASRTQRWSLGGFAEPAIRAPLSCSCCRDGWLQSAAVGVKIEHVSKKSQEMIYIYIYWYDMP